MTHQVGEPPADGRATEIDAANGDQTASSPSTGRKAGRAVREIVETLLLAALIFFAVRLVVLNFRVDGASMVPNLQNEEMLLVNRNAYRSIDLSAIGGLLPGDDGDGANTFYPFAPPERGDIIVFEPPTNSDQPYIKRIIGLPGEEISFRNGQVLVNDIVLDERYIDDETTCRGDDVCEVVVEEGEVFVLGDNRMNSSDSRSFGPVPIDRVVGKAWFTYWPLAELGWVPHYEYDEISERSVALGATPGVAAAVASPQPQLSPKVRRERPQRERPRGQRAVERAAATTEAR